LQDNARLQRAAADERRRALILRAEAERPVPAGGRGVPVPPVAADQRRTEAARLAEEPEERARQDLTQTSAKLTEAVERGRAVVQAQKEESDEAIDDRARRHRMKQLSAETQGLEEKRRR